MSAVPARTMCTTIRIQEALLVTLTQQAVANQKAGDHTPLKQGSIGPKQGQACNWWDGKLCHTNGDHCAYQHQPDVDTMTRANVQKIRRHSERLHAGGRGRGGDQGRQ